MKWTCPPKSLLKFSNSFYGGVSIGENITFDSGYLTTTTDRSYIEYLYGFSTKKNLKSKIVNQVGFSSLFKNRVYVSESEQDVLHSGREHLEYNIAFWIDREINRSTDISLKIKYRFREVSSNYAWVSELKEFNNRTD